MIQMLHSGGTGLGVGCCVMDPSLAKWQGWDHQSQLLSRCPRPCLPTMAALSKSPHHPLGHKLSILAAAHRLAWRAPCHQGRQRAARA